MPLIDSPTTDAEGKASFERNFTDPICYRCGSERVEVSASRVFSTGFDSKSATPLSVMICDNTKCELGCVAKGGHVFPTTLSAILAGALVWGGRTCTRCRYKEPTI